MIDLLTPRRGRRGRAHLHRVREQAVLHVRLLDDRAPFRDASQKIVGVLGVIGPTRLNYARIVPMVDYTAKVMSRILDRSR